jgi:hypothetical protein
MILFFTKFKYDIWWRNNTTSVPKWQSQGHIVLVKALVPFLCKEHHQQMYKNVSLLESDKCCFNDWLLNIVYFIKTICTLYWERTKRRFKKNMSCGILFRLGLCSSLCEKRPSKVVQKRIVNRINFWLYNMYFSNEISLTLST